jgi:DNA-binding beta-propeller fold protein YncE
MMFAVLDFKGGNLLIGITQWSDYGPNTAIVQSFAHGHNFPAEYPHFAGEPIRYHFLFYFLAGNLEFLGLNLAWSVNLLSVLTLVCMLALVVALGQLLFKSRAVGCLASAFFFFHGTLNFVPFLRKQTSFKGALDAIYHLRDYLTSGYPYRGEDWGIWTQVVFLNQRHLASSIGIFLIVLIFLLDRYLEKARQRQLDRAQAAGVVPVPPPAIDEPFVAAAEPRAVTEEGEPPVDVPEFGEAPTTAEVESLEPLSPAADQAATDQAAADQAAAEEAAEEEAKTFHSRAYDEYMRGRTDVTPETGPEKSEALEFAKQSSQEHEASPAVEAPPSESAPFDEPSSPVLETAPLAETPSLETPVPAPAPGKQRGLIAQLVHDNLVSGRGFIFCGLLLGALPYWNAPVFTAAFAVLALFFVLFPYRRYMLGLAFTTALVGLPQVLALRSGNARTGASLIHWGYTLGNVPILQVGKYLGFTFGVKWVLILIGLIFGSWVHWRLFIAMVSLFLLTFCLQFSEEALANHKFINIWLVLANLFVAYGLWRLWHLRIKGWAIPSRILAVLLAAPIVLGGVIDFFPIHNGTYIYTNYSTDRLVKWAQTETKPNAIFLTDKFVNHPILLAGRRIFFGYTYFTWSAGYDLPTREAAYRQMFESKNAHQVFTLLKANHIDYVAYDGGIRGFFKNFNEEQVYAPNFKKVFEGAEYGQLVIYKVPENADFIPASAGPAPAGAQPTGANLFEGSQGKDNGQFNFPRGLAVDNDGNVFVADTNNDRLEKFSPSGVFLSVIGKRGSGPGQFLEPGGIAVDSGGYIYVADVSNHRVQKLKPDGSSLVEWKGPEPGFVAPRDIAIGPDNSIYVVDQGRSQIIRLDPNGKALVVWGSPGKEDGQFSGPTSVVVDGKNDRVYVADPSNKRIEVFDTKGKFISKWIVEAWGAPTGWYFQDLALDSKAGLLYASSQSTDEVLVFDLSGKLLRSLKATAADKVVGASSIALQKNGLLVINTFSARVTRVELPAK